MLFDKRVRCHLNDGTSLSIQASEYHYCTPRKNVLDGNYDEVEILYEGTFNLHIAKHYDGFVHGYVPIEDVEKILEYHGGIDFEKTFEK